MRDLHNNIKTETAFNTKTISSNASFQGNVIDIQGFSSLEFILLSGTITDGTFTINLEESDSIMMQNATSVSDNFLLGSKASCTFTGVDDDKTKKIGYIGNKRYVRLLVTSSGMTSGSTISSIAVKSHAADSPVS